MRGPHDADGDLATVGDEELSDTWGSPAHIRKTPYPRVPWISFEWIDRQAEPEDGAGVAGVDDPVVVDQARQEQRHRLARDLRLGCFSRDPASASSSKTSPRRSAAWRATIESTPASWAGPITAERAFGQLKRNLGL